MKTIWGGGTGQSFSLARSREERAIWTKGRASAKLHWCEEAWLSWVSAKPLVWGVREACGERRNWELSRDHITKGLQRRAKECARYSKGPESHRRVLSSILLFIILIPHHQVCSFHRTKGINFLTSLFSHPLFSIWCSPLAPDRE